MRWVRTATTLAQYCPSQPSRSVSKRLLCFLLTLRCQRVELKENNNNNNNNNDDDDDCDNDDDDDDDDDDKKKPLPQTKEAF